MTVYVHPTAVVGDNFKPAPFALIDDDVRIGDNVILGAFCHVRHGAVIGDNVLVGDHVTIQDGTVIGSHTVVADGAVVGRQPMQSLALNAKCERLPGVTIGERCQIGTHAVILAGTTVGDEAFVVTASIVTKDVPAGAVVMGSPAEIVENAPEGELFAGANG